MLPASKIETCWQMTKLLAACGCKCPVLLHSVLYGWHSKMIAAVVDMSSTCYSNTFRVMCGLWCNPVFSLPGFGTSCNAKLPGMYLVAPSKWQGRLHDPPPNKKRKRKHKTDKERTV